MRPNRGGRASSSTAVSGLLDREPELAALHDLIGRAVTGSGQLVMIEGPAGIGKTALLAAAREMAEQERMLILGARARELEQEFSHGVTRQLLERVLHGADPVEHDALLDGAARLAWPLFDPGEAGPASFEAAPRDDLRFTLVHGLYWLIVNLADAGPVMIAVDDAHWSDLPSLGFISYLAARCSDLAVAMILTARSGEPTAAHELLSGMRSDLGTALLTPGSLSPDSVAELVSSAFGEQADERFSAACEHATAGNPLLLKELIAELRAEHLRPTAASVAHVEGVRPDAVGRVVLARLARLGSDAQVLARAVALLEKAPLRRAAALARLDDDAARRAADRLAAAQILARSMPLMFVHPLLRWAIYESIPPAARADGHRRAALLLASDEIGGAALGTHLLRSESAGDERIVQLLRDAAREARRDGEPLAAARLLERALNEPPSEALRGEVLGELGEAEALAHNPLAVAHLEEALALSSPGVRARLACILGEQLVWGGRLRRAHELLTKTIAGLGDDADPRRLAALETIRSGAASVDHRLVGEVDPRLPALHELALAAGPAGRALLIFEACWRAQRGPYDGGWRELLDQGLDHGRFIAQQSAGSAIVDYAAAVLVLADEVPRAQALLIEINTDARRRGSIHSHLTAITWEALLALRRGDLDQAQADARNAMELSVRHQMIWTQAWSAAVLGQALLDSGDLEGAATALDQAPIEQVRGSSAALHLLLARGRCRDAQGRRAEAIEDLRATGAAVIVNNPSYVPWRSTLALALAGDDRDQAISLVDQELARARELGQPRGIGVALRTRGMLAQDGSGVALLSAAVRALRGSPARLELARGLCELGAARRRTGRRAAAREPLREALELAVRCGAEPIVRRAREELLATGAHPRRERLSGPDSLTPAERRVADLAAQGLSNREIAQALFVTTKTVGTHLGHIYQKLDLEGARARERIGARLSSPRP